MTLDPNFPLDSTQLPNFPAYLRARWVQLNATYIMTTMVFSVAGTLTTGVNKSWGIPVQVDITTPPVIVSANAYVKTAPTGASIKVDINKDGTTIFTNQANRPEIAISANIGTDKIPDITTLGQNNVLTLDVDQIGSSTAGADLSVVLKLKHLLQIP